MDIATPGVSAIPTAGVGSRFASGLRTGASALYGRAKSTTTSPKFLMLFVYLLVPALLFLLLSPGMLLTLPPVKVGGAQGKIWASGQTSWEAAAVHSVVFLLLITVIFYFAHRAGLGM